MDLFCADSPQNKDFSLEYEENYTENISNTSLNIQFPRKSYVKFWLCIVQEFLRLSRKTLNILYSQHPTCVGLNFQLWQPSTQCNIP
jgi:hypothetical protein